MDPTRRLTHSKSRFKKRVKLASVKISNLFRRVKGGAELDMGEVYDLANRVSSLGGEAEKLAVEVRRLEMTEAVKFDIQREMLKLQTYSTQLRKVAEAYFGFVVKGLPVYAMPEGEAVVKTSAIQELLKEEK